MKGEILKSKLLLLLESPTFMTWGSRLVRALNIIWVMPLVVTSFSIVEIKLWYSFIALTSLVVIFDFGFNATFVRYLSYAQVGVDSSQNRISIDDVVPTMQRVYFVLACLFVLGGGFAYWAFVDTINLVEEPREALKAFLVVCTGGVVYIYGNYYQSFLFGCNKVAQVMKWDTVSNMGSVTTSILILVNDGGIFYLALVQQSWVFFNVLRNYFLCKRIRGFNTANQERFNITFFREIWGKAWKSGVGVLMITGLTQILAIFYSKVSTTELGASYMLSLSLLQQINVFAQAPFYSKIPLLSQLRVKNDIKGLIKTSQQGMKLSYITLLVCVIGMSVFGEAILELLGSKSGLVSIDLWFLMSMAFLIERYGAMHIQVFTTTNKIIWHITNGVAGCVTILMVFLLFSSIGVYALPLGALIGNLGFYSWYSSIHSYRSLNMNFWEYEKEVLLLPIILLCCFGLISFFLNQYPMIPREIITFIFKLSNLKP